MSIDPQAAADAARAWIALEPQLAAHDYASPAGGGGNVTAAWRWATGAGVTVALLDDGFDVAASEAGFDAAASRAFTDAGVQGGAAAVAEGPGLVHGTTTAGDLAANGSGPVGVAPDATLVGVKEGFGSGTDPAQLAAGLGYAASVAAVVNNSWGVTGLGTAGADGRAFAAWFAAVGGAVAQGRGGLGTAIVFAGGNERASGADLGLQGIADDPRVIAVAGVERGGAVAPFSTPGAGLLVAATATGVLTTAPGGQVALSAGTSYAAPEVSGVVALMLQANPGLGWRDVQEILADSAYLPVGATSSDGGFAATGVVVNAASDWNGGGRHFSDDIGFGVVDADTAVSLARAWTLVSDDADQASAGATAAPALALAGGRAASSLAVTSALRIQHVQVSVDAPGVSVAGLTLVLVSPAGTRAVLLQDAGSVAGQDQTGGMTLPADPITANAFWGESAAGTWTLLLQDANGADAGVLRDWTLTVTGDAPGAVSGIASGAAPLVFTPEFAALAAADPARTRIGGGTAIDVVGAMTGATTLDLNGGAGVLDGVAVQLAPGLGSASFAGDTQAVRVTAPRSGAATITGGDGPTMILGGDGADTLVAGGGPTTIGTGHGASLVDLAQAGGAQAGGAQAGGAQAGGAQAGEAQAGAATDYVTLDGQDTLLGGTGPVVAAVGGGGRALVFQGAGALAFTGGGGADTVVGAGAPATVYGGSGSIAVFSGGGGTFVGGAGTAMVLGRAADTIWAAGGGSFYAGPDSLVALSGGSSVVTAGAGSVVSVSGAADALVVAGSGNATLDGGAGSGAQVLYAGSGSDLVRGGSGADILFVGTGSATLAGGAGGATLFAAVDGAAGGTDVIAGFRPGTDRLMLLGYGAQEATRAVAGAVVAGGSTQVSLSDGTRLDFVGVSGLHASGAVLA